jgi:hypothetical protein
MVAFPYSLENVGIDHATQIKSRVPKAVAITYESWEEQKGPFWIAQLSDLIRRTLGMGF